MIFIRLQSNQSADNFQQNVITKVNKLSDDTHVHRVDPLKRKNDGNYLYFEILKLRISYYSAPNEVIIVRVRHTKQNLQNIEVKMCILITPHFINHHQN